MKQQKALTLKTLTKSNVWEVEENDIFRMWETAEKESDFRDNRNHYIDVIRSAFEIEEIKMYKPEVSKKYEARDFKVGNIHDMKLRAYITAQLAEREPYYQQARHTVNVDVLDSFAMVDHVLSDIISRLPKQ